ncbi:hypothetical protein [Coraliomargarita akajimensis]|uniref:Lipoprotein n=1 Tax=Coraliomargarita akajimensis (strain DSM 45221 / IAM 15411 / JCM 23193 / KCTC 12865 / 04OKA010-24) TaxID=583355 RepID=D5ELY8_CORAD|nr:hypothetical protein [Coraliomargarita akajimensis]ADE53313.1 hypothetical protein Caka_0287 [Coraliomargarita akajimensis DSM 45221]
MRILNFTLPLILSGALLLAGCYDSSNQITKERKVKAVTFTSEQGVKSELKLDDGDGHITSGFNGKNTHQEVRELSVEVTSSTYLIRTENKTYYIPTTYMLEVLD